MTYADEPSASYGQLAINMQQCKKLHDKQTMDNSRATLIMTLNLLLPITVVAS